MSCLQQSTRIRHSANYRPHRRQNPPTNLPLPRRPFLRRQESHSVVYANNAKITHTPVPPPKRRRRWRHMVVRFLLPQEWSTCVRTIVCEYGVVCRHNTVRFLPTQEWSTCVRTIVCEYGVVCRNDTVRFLPTQEWSCGGRGIVSEFWHCCHSHYLPPPPHYKRLPTIIIFA